MGVGVVGDSVFRKVVLVLQLELVHVLLLVLVLALVIALYRGGVSVTPTPAIMSLLVAAPLVPVLILVGGLCGLFCDSFCTSLRAGGEGDVDVGSSM